MNAKVIKISDKKGPLSVEVIKMKIRSECENVINFSTQEQKGITFLKFENELWKQLSYMGSLFIQLFLMSCHERLNYSKWLNTGLYYARKALIAKTIKTVFGKVTVNDNRKLTLLDNPILTHPLLIYFPLSRGA